MANDLRIVELKAENFARLRAVQIRPTPGEAVKISGRNKQGKTSVLNAIETALRGRSGAPTEAIRQGARKAELRLDLGDIIIERSITRGEDGERWSLTVTRADGAKIARSPQAVIDAFYSNLSIDPLAFTRGDAKAQIEMLKRLVPGFDFALNEKRRKEAYDHRTSTNREQKEHAMAAVQLDRVLPPGPAPEPIDVKALTEAHSQASKRNAKLQEEKFFRKAARVASENALEQAEKMRSQASQMILEAERMEMEHEENLRRIEVAEESAEQPADLSTLVAEINDADQRRALLEQYARRTRHEETAQIHADASQKLTEEIAALDAAKRAALASANLPAGISFDDDGVYLNDLPFSQASSAEAMEVACAVAMALSPQLKVILVDGAERLDSHEMGVLEGLAKQGGYDLWLTRVDESGKCGFTIEDGEIR